MLRLWKTSPKSISRHEDLFLERYERLLSWSMKLTDGDWEQAEDLVHDAFIQFTFSHPDLEAIHNLDGYLYSVLRNTYLSQVRRAARAPVHSLSVIEYETAETGLQRAQDVLARMQVQDELRKVCQYACSRKESSKAGSVLILRFFHGYFPGEIAKILGNSTKAVSELLRVARAEAKAALNNPQAPSVTVEGTTLIPVSPVGPDEPVDKLLGELRYAIFRSRKGECLSDDQLRESYLAPNAKQSHSETLDCQSLAHIVSCPDCLDRVNKLLGLTRLSDRHPPDMLGPDTKGGLMGGPEGGEGRGSSRERTIKGSVTRCRRRAKEVFEYRPKELCISVNGHILVAQTVSSELSKQVVSVNLDEEIAFAEVLSENGTRLIALNVEPPPTGLAEQSSRVELSDGRRVELTLSFDSPWPNLHVFYHDPTLAEGESAKATVRGLSGSPTVRETSVDEVQRPTSNVQSLLGKGFGLSERMRVFRTDFARKAKGFGPWTLDIGLFSRPGPVTAVLALLLIATLVFIQMRTSPPPLSAAELLQRSVAAEDATAASTDQVLHRTINLEERLVTQTSSLSNEGALIARRRIEVWQSAERGITARRLYDDRGSLVAGDWIRNDRATGRPGDRETVGSRTIYRSHKLGDKRATEGSQSSIGNRQSAIGNVEVWQLSPSAKEFTSLIGPREVVHFEEQPTSYVIRYEQEGTEGGAPGLAEATLRLSRADLHATELTLLVQDEDSNRQSAIGNRQFREYRFVETSYERRPMSAVAPAVFEPDREFLGDDAETSRHGDTENVRASPRLRVPESLPLATASLEVEVLQLLNSAGADLGEQINIRRTLEGELRIEGVVETRKRKDEILKALQPLSDNPALKVDLQTVEEATKRTRQRESESGAVVVEREETASDKIPVDADVRRFLNERGIATSQLDDEVRSVASKTLSQSNQVMRHAWALKSLGERFSPEDIRDFDEQARAKWRSLIRSHAAALRRESARLSQELAPIFPRVLSGSMVSEAPINNDDDLVRAVRELFSLCSANDRMIRAAFSVSSDAARANGVQSPQFGHDLKSIEVLAGKISKQ